jgi:hypothetical protein
VIRNLADAKSATRQPPRHFLKDTASNADRRGPRGAPKSNCSPLRNIKIIYFYGRNPYSAQKWGPRVLQFLVEHTTVLGFEIQNWMLIVVGVLVAYILFLWKTRDRA